MGFVKVIAVMAAAGAVAAGIGTVMTAAVFNWLFREGGNG